MRINRATQSKLRKQKMTKKDYTHLTLVVDRSGSMEEMQTEAQGGINTLLAEQFALPRKLTVTLVEFDDKIDTVTRLAKKSFDYDLKPRGMTALLDAVGAEIVKTGADLAKMKEEARPEKVIFVIVTDGMENSSHEYNIAKIKEMIAHQKDAYKWEFQFLGAGEAAWQGEELGMNTTNYSDKLGGSSRMYHSLSASIKSYRDADAEDAVFKMPETIE